MYADDVLLFMKMSCLNMNTRDQGLEPRPRTRA